MIFELLESKTDAWLINMEKVSAIYHRKKNSNPDSKEREVIDIYVDNVEEGFISIDAKNNPEAFKQAKELMDKIASQKS